MSFDYETQLPLFKQNYKKLIYKSYFFIAFTKCGLGSNELVVSHDSRMVEYIWYCP